MPEIELSVGTIEYEDTGGDGPVLVLLMDASLRDGSSPAHADLPHCPGIPPANPVTIVAAVLAWCRAGDQRDPCRALGWALTRGGRDRLRLSVSLNSSCPRWGGSRVLVA
jgi:hypothetical protein